MNCPSCGTAVRDDARFCEACGTPLGAAAASGAPAAQGIARGAAAGAFAGGNPLDDAPISAPTRKPAAALPDPPSPGRRPCAECGGEVGPDLYCLSCGTKAPSERDHFAEQPASWVAGVCDKGVTKSRNEDAMALLAGAEPGSRAVLVVMDGVSNSIDSDVASLAGAHAAREVLRMPLPAGMGTPESREAAVRKVFTDAATAANTAIIAVTDPDSPNPASATFTTVVVEGTQAWWANVGDSRSYWIPDVGDAVQLTTDDSLAQAQIAGGVAREVAEASPQAHAITKWLGRDSEDPTPTVGTMALSGSGWLLACSDGLWNYASTPEEMAAQVRAAAAADLIAEPAALALALVAFANDSGGHDNITAALARVGGAALGHNGAPEQAAPTDPALPDTISGGEPTDG